MSGYRLFPQTLVDGAKRIVEIPKRPTRIISLSPGITELLFSVGAGKQVVAVTTWCNYPEAVKSLPKVGDMNVNLELVVSLNPDLIVADGSLQPATAERLDKLGLPVFVINPKDIAGILDSLELLGRVTGNIDTSQDLVTELTQLLSKTRRRVESGPLAEKPVSVLVLFGTDQLYSAGRGTFLDQAITRAGGYNIAREAEGSWPLLSEEFVLAADPEVVLLTYGSPQDLASRPNWQGVAAVQNRQIHSIDPDRFSRPTARLIRGIPELYELFLAVRGQK
ncbi:MAG: cobalamin-binding protein [Firmicutes bacterium]|nr:cobalamin-binding protein [Bacillota bacterium]